MKVYLRLDKEMSERFSWVKEHLGLTNDTEVVRYLINKEWREQKEEKEKRDDFSMFKRLLFQVRDEAITEESYLHFLAGYFGVIPTPEDLKIPEKGCFKLEEKESL